MTEMQNYALSGKHLEFNIPIIDTQHANIIRMTNNLFLAYLKSSENVNSRFFRAVKETVDYYRFHFNTEEKLMLLLDFPEYLDHKKVHDDFIWEISGLTKQCQEEQSNSLDKLVNFLNEWIFSHIEVSDKVFADFFLAMKHHGKIRLILTGSSQLSAQLA